MKPYHHDPLFTLPKLDQFDFHQRMIEMRGTVLVIFTSPDCGGCRHLRQVLREVRRQQADWRVFEVDAQQDPGLASEFEIFHLPAMLLFHEGQFHCELRAEARTVSIEKAVIDALLRAPEEAP